MGRSSYYPPWQRPPHRQGGLLDEPDDLKLLGGGVPHVASSPSAVTLFLSRRFSRVNSATTSFSALASRRRSLTSSDVAARVVSPASRFFPASRKSFDQRYIEVLDDPLAAAELGDTVLAAQ